MCTLHGHVLQIIFWPDVWNCLPVVQAGRLPVLCAAHALSKNLVTLLPWLITPMWVSERMLPLSFIGMAPSTLSCPLYHFERLIFNSEIQNFLCSANSLQSTVPDLLLFCQTAASTLHLVSFQHSLTWYYCQPWICLDVHPPCIAMCVSLSFGLTCGAASLWLMLGSTTYTTVRVDAKRSTTYSSRLSHTNTQRHIHPDILNSILTPPLHAYSLLSAKPTYTLFPPSLPPSLPQINSHYHMPTLHSIPHQSRLPLHLLLQLEHYLKLLLWPPLHHTTPFAPTYLVLQTYTFSPGLITTAMHTMVPTCANVIYILTQHIHPHVLCAAGALSHLVYVITRIPSLPHHASMTCIMPPFHWTKAQPFHLLITSYLLQVLQSSAPCTQHTVNLFNKATFTQHTPLWQERAEPHSE